MRKLDPIIARFVDDVVRLATEATRDNLRRVLAEASQRPWKHPRPRSSRPIRSVGRRSALASAIAIVTTEVPPPSPAAEITDPQWLLAMGPSEPLDVPDIEQVEMVPESVSEAPASTTRELGGPSPVRLRANETLARVSNAGVVIRRAR